MRKLGISAQTSPWLLFLVFLVLSGGIGYTGYRYFLFQQEQFSQSATNELNAIADLKVSQIESWRAERLGDGAMIQGNPLIALAAQKLFVAPTSAQSTADTRAWMSAMASSYHYAEILLLDTQGRVRLTLSGDSALVNPALMTMAVDAMRTGQVGLSDLYFADAGMQIRMDVAAPLVVDHSSVGVVILTIDPYQFLFPLIQSWPTYSQSAETLLVRQEGSDVIYLNELRHQKGTALTLRYPITTPNLPAALAVQGQIGITSGIDYRGIAVLSALRRVSDSPWFLVAKVDQQEIYAALQQRSQLLTVVTGSLVLFAAAMVFAFYRQQRIHFFKSENQALVQRHILLTRLENLVKYANDIILMADNRGNILEANERAVQSYGYSHDELLQMNISQLRPPTGNQAAAADLLILEMSKGKLFEDMHLRKDGSTFPVEVSAQSIEVEGLHYIQEIIRDISDRKQAEEQILRFNQELEGRVQQRTAELEAANRELEAFTYSVSHDLRAPLRAIDGFSNILLEDFTAGLNPETQRYLNLIRKNTQQMGQLVDDLLKFSRLSHQALKKELVFPTDFARLAVKNLENDLGERVVQFIIQEMPPCQADRLLLNQVYINLLSNAVKFTRRHPAAIVEVGCLESTGQEAQVPNPAGTIYYVKDNGSGFDMRYAGKLFGIFQRLHRMDEFEGTGVGLAIVQRIIHRHGGQVWAEGELDKGATFFFTLGE